MLPMLPMKGCTTVQCTIMHCQHLHLRAAVELRAAPPDGQRLSTISEGRRRRPRIRWPDMREGAAPASSTLQQCAASGLPRSYACALWDGHTHTEL